MFEFFKERIEAQYPLQEVSSDPNQVTREAHEVSKIVTYTHIIVPYYPCKLRTFEKNNKILLPLKKMVGYNYFIFFSTRA